VGISPVPLGLYGDETITACAWISGITGLGFVVRALLLAARKSTPREIPFTIETKALVS
jgi:hypothetical protein